MNSVAQFFDKYEIDGLYDNLLRAHGSKNAVKPFYRERHVQLSFGVIPGYRKYDLFYERYFSACRILSRCGAIPSKDCRVLDVGCGEGFFKFFFDATVPHKVAWHGIEVWKARADFCRGVGYDIVQDVNLDTHVLPYADGHFDIVLASHVIEHLKAPHDAIREMARVLRPGGHLLVATPTKPPIVDRLLSYRHGLHAKATGQTQQAFTHRSLERLVISATGWGKQAVVDKRGFRWFSARKRLPLEDWKWFYRVSVFLGRHIPALAPEINLILRKPAA